MAPWASPQPGCRTACKAGYAMRTLSTYPLSNTTTEPCLYVADATSATKGLIWAYDSNGTVVYSLNVSTPTALAIDHTRQRLYAAIATNLLVLDIAHGLRALQTACSCSTSFFVLSSAVTGVGVDETSGTVYFAYSNYLCYVDETLASPNCTSYTTWPLGLLDSFGALTISQERREMYVLGTSTQNIYRFSLAGGGYPTMISSAFQPYPLWVQLASPFWGIAMRKGYILLGVSPGITDGLEGLLMLDPATGDSVAALSPAVYLDQYSDLVYDNDTDHAYNLITSGLIFPTYSVSRFDVTQTGGLLTQTDVTTFIPTGVLKDPQALVTGPCPWFAPSPSPSITPSPSPSIVPISDNSGTTNLLPLAIVVPAVFGSALACCACGVVVAALVVFVVRRRRRWYESEAERVGGEGDVEMSTAPTFTYREIDSSELKLGRLLGQGAFGKVYKGEYRGAVVAVKMFEGVRLDQADNRLIKELRTEAQMMDTLSNHPNIVKFVGAVTQAAELDTSFALVLEYCPRGSLYDLLVKKKKRLPLITLVRMARDAAFGVLHLHKEKVIHRDLAARNLLIGQNYEVYVSDFGLARVKESEEEAGYTKQSFGPVGWMAPEALQNRHYSEATDAFSFGVMLWEMMARRRPWAGIEVAQILTAVVSNTRLKIPSDCDPVFRRLMKQCWRQNPAHRPSFDKIVITLSDYYQTLKKIQDVDTESVDLSEESEEEVTDDIGRSDVSFSSWEQRRMKDEIKSFLKQIIIERGDEDSFGQVESAYLSALQDLRRRYAPADASDDSFPIIHSTYNSLGQHQQPTNLQSMNSGAYLSIISRKNAPPPPMKNRTAALVTEDDGETTGGESAGSSVVSRSSQVSKRSVVPGQLASASELPSPRKAGEGWLSPYAFPVLNSGERGGSSQSKKQRNSERGGAAHGNKNKNKNKKNVKWNEEEEDVNVEMKEEEEREEEGVGSSRNLKASMRLAQEGGGGSGKETAAKTASFASYSTLVTPNGSGVGPTSGGDRGGDDGGGESASAPSIEATSEPSHHQQRPLPKTPPPRRPPRNSYTPPSVHHASVPKHAVTDQRTGQGVAVRHSVAGYAAVDPAKQARTSAPDRSRPPPRPPRKSTASAGGTEY